MHQTGFEVSDVVTHIQELFRALVDDEARTMAICDNVVAAAAKGRNCLVLTQWTEHLRRLGACCKGNHSSRPSGWNGEEGSCQGHGEPGRRVQARRLSSRRRAASLARGSIVRRSTRYSWPSQSRFGEELSSTLAGSCGPWMASHPLKSMITSTSRAQCSPGCTKRDSRDIPPSVSTLVRIARVEASSSSS